jgi:hypothetical protein
MAAPTDSKESQFEMSRVMKQKTANELYFLQIYYRYVALAAIIISVPIIIMSSYWADILAKADMYTDFSAHWETCLTRADYQTIAFKTLTNLTTTAKIAGFDQCMSRLVGAGACSTVCEANVENLCSAAIGGSLNDIPINSGHFLGSVSYIGIQSVIFALIAHGNMMKALRHPSWLISACGMMMWFSFSIFTYYAVSPVLPVPGQTNATLMTLLYYEGDYTKYHNANGGDNKCLTAYRYVWVYLTFLILLAATIFAGLILGLYAENIRYKSKNKKHYEHLDHTEAPRILGILAISFYIMFAVSKMMSSYTELNAINQFNETPLEAVRSGKTVYFTQLWFPLAQPNVDLTTLLGISACISILRGFTVQSVSAFGLAGAMSAVYSFSSWPGVVGAYEFYYHNNFDNFDSCYNYFLSPCKFSINSL